MDKIAEGGNHLNLNVAVKTGLLSQWHIAQVGHRQSGCSYVFCQCLPPVSYNLFLHKIFSTSFTIFCYLNCLHYRQSSPLGRLDSNLDCWMASGRVDKCNRYVGLVILEPSSSVWIKGKKVKIKFTLYSATFAHMLLSAAPAWQTGPAFCLGRSSPSPCSSTLTCAAMPLHVALFCHCWYMDYYYINVKNCSLYAS